MITNTFKNSHVYIYIVRIRVTFRDLEFKATPSLDSHLCNHCTLKIPTTSLSCDKLQMGPNGGCTF